MGENHRFSPGDWQPFRTLEPPMESRLNGVARELNIKEKWAVDSFIWVAVHAMAP